uniref:Uncharacterized protein n=1 Tax=Plectus sambesii TaxID=2011161 RepID=A0A914WIL3_9BILA
MFADVLRVVVANVLSLTIGLTFYSPKINPLARTLSRFHMSKKNYKTEGMAQELLGTVISNTIIAILLMRFMDERAYSLLEVSCLAFKMTLVSAALQVTHYMWKQGPLVELAINCVYDFLVLSTIAFTVTFMRYRKFFFF